MEPNGSQGRGIPGEGKGKGTGQGKGKHFFYYQETLCCREHVCIKLSLIEMGLRSLRQLVPNSNHQMQSGLISFSHWSHIGPTLVSPHPPRPPQEFCQFCQNSCSERLPALVLFRNVARITPHPIHPDHPKNFANVVRILVSKCCQH